MRYRPIGIIVFILCVVFVSFAAHAQQAIYLVRHTEQALDIEDPPLTEAGHRRAKALAGVLKDAGIKVIYTSKKRRTKQTAEHLVKALNIPSEVIPRKDVAGLINRLRTQHKDDRVLIVSHSRTIPKLLKEMGHSADVTIARDEYDSLFVIVPRGEDESIVLRLRF